jgi:hypothetical protein
VDLPQRYRDLWHFEEGGAGMLWGVRAVSGSLLYAALLLSTALLLLSSLWAVIRILRSRRLPSDELVAASVLTVLGIGVLNYSGPGWMRLVVILPPLFLLWGLVLARQPLSERASALLRWGVTGLLVLGVLCHAAPLLGHRPQAWEYLDVDRIDRDSPLNRSIRELPFLSPGDTIVVLPTGGSVYLYTYPSAIGFTYLFPLGAGYNDLEDHRLAARQMETERPAAVFVHKVVLRGFLSEGEPIAELLRRDYAMGPESPAVKVFVRKDRLP